MYTHGVYGVYASVAQRRMPMQTEHCSSIGSGAGLNAELTAKVDEKDLQNSAVQLQGPNCAPGYPQEVPATRLLEEPLTMIQRTYRGISVLVLGWFLHAFYAMANGCELILI